MTRKTLRYSPRILTILLCLLLPAGCAKGPSGGSLGGNGGNGSGPQLIVTVTFQGTINPADFYYVLFNVNNTPGPNNTGFTGPIPVVTPRDAGGNGFAAGAFSHYVLYHPPQPQSSDYGVYAISPDLRTSSYLARPVQAQTTSNTLQFQIPLSYLATSAVTVDQINTIQINIIATNVVSVDPNYAGPDKDFDALGNPFTGQVNAPISIPVQQAGVFRNTGSVDPESQGDVADVGNGGSFTPLSDNDPAVAALDIVDYSIEVRR